MRCRENPTVLSRQRSDPDAIQWHPPRITEPHRVHCGRRSSVARDSVICRSVLWVPGVDALTAGRRCRRHLERVFPCVAAADGEKARPRRSRRRGQGDPVAGCRTVMAVARPTHWRLQSRDLHGGRGESRGCPNQTPRTVPAYHRLRSGMLDLHRLHQGSVRTHSPIAGCFSRGPARLLAPQAFRTHRAPGSGRLPGAAAECARAGSWPPAKPRRDTAHHEHLSFARRKAVPSPVGVAAVPGGKPFSSPTVHTTSAALPPPTSPNSRRAATVRPPHKIRMRRSRREAGERPLPLSLAPTSRPQPGNRRRSAPRSRRHRTLSTDPRNHRVVEIPARNNRFVRSRKDAWGEFTPGRRPDTHRYQFG